jgi:hypothetical protein
MAKVTMTLNATLTKNTAVEKGGAWLLTIKDRSIPATHSAWSNPSAAKRYLKSYVLENTPRKSIKLVVGASNDAGKPTHLSGELTWKSAA